MLAHHYLSALEFARAAGQPTESLADPARLALRAAGDRSAALNAFPAAERFYRAAFEIWPVDDTERPDLLLRLGRTFYRRRAGGEDVLEEAVERLLESGDPEGAAEAMALLADGLLDGVRAAALLERAVELVAGRPLSAAKATVLIQQTIRGMVAGRPAEAIASGREALAIAEHLGLATIRAEALNRIGCCRVMTGDLEGLADLERSIEIAREANSPALVRGYKNLSSALVDMGELERASELQRMYKQAAEHFGQHFEVRWADGELAFQQYLRGDWDEAVRIADTFIAAVEGGAPHYMEAVCRELRSLIRLARDDPSGALADLAAELDFARKVNDLQVLIPALATGAFVFVHMGRPADAAMLGDELLESLPAEYLGWGICSFELAVALTHLGRGDELLGAAARVARLTPWLEAAVALAAGEPARAAELYGRMGARPQEAFARLNAAEQLIAQGRRPEGDAELQQALAFFRSVGARAYIARGEALLAASA